MLTEPMSAFRGVEVVESTVRQHIGACFTALEQKVLSQLSEASERLASNSQATTEDKPLLQVNTHHCSGCYQQFTTLIMYTAIMSFKRPSTLFHPGWASWGYKLSLHAMFLPENECSRHNTVCLVQNHIIHGCVFLIQTKCYSVI